MITTCQCRFMDFNKSITVVPYRGSEGGGGEVGQEAHGDTVYFVHSFAVNLKLF